MKGLLNDCFRAFVRTVDEHESLLETWIREVVQIDGGTKQKRIDKLKQFGVSAQNSAERDDFNLLEEQGLVLGFQVLNTQYFAISLAGLIEVMKDEGGLNTEDSLNQISDCICSELVSTLPKLEKMSIQEASIFLFCLVVSDEEGVVDLNDENFALNAWQLFCNEFLSVLKDHAHLNSVLSLEEKIKHKKIKHQNFQTFMGNLKFLTNQKVITANSKTYRFSDEQTIERFVNFLTQSGDFTADVMARFSLATKLQDLRDLAHMRCIINTYESPFFSTAVQALRF